MKDNVKYEIDNRTLEFLKSENGPYLRTARVSPIEDAPIDKIGYKQGNMEWLEAKSALRAVESILREHRYAHPATTFGLHIFAEADLNQDGTNLGVVSTQYEGELVTPPYPGQFPGDWAQLNRMDGRFYLSGFSENWRFARVRKHNWIDKVQVLGHGVDIGCTPWSATVNADGSMNTAEEVLALFAEKDDEKMRQIKYQGNAVAQMKWRMGRGRREERVDQQHGVIRKVENVPLMVTTVDGELVNMYDVPVGMVRVYDQNGHGTVEPWNGGFRSIQKFQEVALAKGWTIEIL